MNKLAVLAVGMLTARAVGRQGMVNFTPGTHFLGSSTVGFVQHATGLGLPPNLFGTEPGQVAGFSRYEVIPAPEPTPVAMLVIGLVALPTIRRKPMRA